jgi:hypothetical protein
MKAKGVLQICTLTVFFCTHSIESAGVRGRATPRETSYLNPPWQATDNSNPQIMGLPKWDKSLKNPHIHVHEFPNGHIVWPALSYDPKKQELGDAPPPPPKFGPAFGQTPGGQKEPELPPSNYPPDMFEIKEPANAPPEWHKEPGETVPGIPDKPCPSALDTKIKDVAAADHKFMSPHPQAPKGETESFMVSAGGDKC